jgi:hypothetical protein
MDQQTFTLLDVSTFPIVRFNLEGRSGDYAEAWTREMDALLGNGRPFVLLVLGNRGEESQEDKKVKAAWFKINRETLASVCRGIVSVEPDREKRAALAVQGAQIGKAFGIPFTVAETAREAEELAPNLLRP